MTSLKVINSNELSEENISMFIPRTNQQLEEIRSDVLKINNDVMLNGDASIFKFTKKFDQVEISKTELKVSETELEEAYNIVDKKLLDALKVAKKNLLKYHKAQKKDDWTITIEKGVKAGQIYRPLDSVGLYIPGGRAIYPSTVLMAATPAFVAGVKEIIICSPPQTNKKIAPEILVAAKEFEIEKIYKVGGAQAIAAMAYGTETIPRVQKIIGPGNKWVNASKQLLSNIVAIDTPAGPSEVLIIADETADYRYVILDLLSQIEHDPENIGIIISTSSDLSEKITENIDDYIIKSERKEIISLALKNNSLLINAPNIEESIRLSNFIAPEHLQIMTRNPKDVMKYIYNAGAIFLGLFSPVPLGDYSAGTNHILPTGGNAKKYSGLNIFDFIKMIDVLECDKDGLKSLSESATTIAQFEGFFAHKKSIEERLKKTNKI